MDSSSDSDMDGPSILDAKAHNNVSNASTNSHAVAMNAASAAQSSQAALQMQLNAHHQHAAAATGISSVIQAAASHGSGKAGGLGQLSSSALSAVAYSHLHSVMGNMPIYDMGDYQHL